MVEAKAKRVRGRPKGSRNKAREVKASPKPDAELEALLETEAAGNGRDEAAYEHREEMHRQWEQAATEPVGPAPAREHIKGSGPFLPDPPEGTPPRVVLPDLFIHCVQNGYIVRPAYAQGDHRTSSDVRTWVVASKEALADLVVSLIADPVVHAVPVRQSQDYYSPPLIVETATGPIR
jgi:hypothetical protein